ncbi:unnamed protein product [Blepharisma stoltei]|uniref:AAA+ ATPase domain-containing protein n=1 Tax=Blepharisma stoltei TaxID=1481888 RepID=A0AAU9IJY0_9CILI|nr:unnamed protein product [Blepharisma stoltei]
MNNIVVVISGCPGSGKTTLAKYLARSLDGILLSYDDILRELGNFSVENFHQARILFLERFLEIMNNCDSKIILIDDVNHLKSLIKPYKRIAQQHSSKFLHLIIDISLENALSQNLQRENQVTEEVLITHYEKLQQEKFWKNSKHIQSQEIEKMSQKAILLTNEAEVLRPRELISVPQQQSLMHEIDIELRKCVRSLILAVPDLQRKEFAELANKTKQDVMALMSKIPEPTLDYAKWQFESIISLKIRK